MLLTTVSGYIRFLCYRILQKVISNYYNYLFLIIPTSFQELKSQIITPQGVSLSCFRSVL